jgi:hypothetical protein
MLKEEEMSAIHTNKTDNGTVDVIFHIPVQAGANRIGITWVECVKNCPDFPKTSQALQKDDLPAIKNGEIIEHREAFTFSSPDLTDAQKLEELQVRFNELEIQVNESLQKILKYFGGENNP